jgi:hypothetical protein
VPFFVRVDGRTVHAAETWDEVLVFVAEMFAGIGLSADENESVEADVFSGESDETARFVLTLDEESPENRPAGS